VVIVMMGVVGAGKTTVGRLLAEQLAWKFVDADSFHSPPNIEKMTAGKPLTDSDRIPWLEAIHTAIAGWVSQKQDVVLACSALKRSYRLKMSGPEVVFVYLRGDPALVAQRLRSRTGHYATEQLLSSQLEALEEPEHAITVDVDTTPAQIVSEIRRRLALG
jgi:gluconokinase